MLVCQITHVLTGSTNCFFTPSFETCLFLFKSGFSYFYKFVPSAPVRAFTVFAGPIPPELTADTLMTYMV